MMRMHTIVIYLKQAWKSLRENPLAGIFTLLGTTLAAAMLLVLAQFCYVKTAAYKPVSNRDRLLYVTGVMGVGMTTDSAGQRIESGSRWMDALGVPFVREVFYGAKLPEAVTALTYETRDVYVNRPGSDRGEEFKLRLTDDAFWRVFDLTFLAGKPYDAAAFRSGLRQVVISSDVAGGLFGSVAEAVGQAVRVDYVDYTVTGVVEPVSEVVQEACGQLYIPYSCNQVMMERHGAGGICGSDLAVFILARTTDDFDAISDEVTRLTARFNANCPDWKADLFTQPHSANRHLFQEWQETHPGPLLSGLICLAALFFLLPVFNLLGITFGLMRRRQEEVGVRKAFGATAPAIVRQMLCENLIITVAGCLLGQVLSLVFFWVAKDALLRQTGAELTADMVFNPWFLALALVICLVINVLSTGIPAWRLARTQTVEALEDRYLNH